MEEVIRWISNYRRHKTDKQDFHLISCFPAILDIGNRASSLIIKLSLCPCLCKVDAKWRCGFLKQLKMRIHELGFSQDHQQESSKSLSISAVEGEDSKVISE